MHRQTQFREHRLRGRIAAARFHPSLRPAKTIPQRTRYIGITQVVQKPTNMVRLSPRLVDQAKRRSLVDPARLGVFINPALKRATLSRTIRVNPARTIRAQRRTRLTKISNRRPTARGRHRQTQCLQFFRILARAQLDVIKKRPVAAQAARQAQFFRGVHTPPSRHPPTKRKPRLQRSCASRPPRFFLNLAPTSRLDDITARVRGYSLVVKLHSSKVVSSVRF